MMPQLGDVPLTPALLASLTSAGRAMAVADHAVPSLERLYLMSPVGVSCQTTTAYAPVQNNPTLPALKTFVATSAVQVVHCALTVGSVIFWLSSVPEPPAL